MSNTKENATLRKIHNDGTQEFHYGDSQFNVILLSGEKRIENVEVGDVGKLIWKTPVPPAHGFWHFEKYSVFEEFVQRFGGNPSTDAKYFAFEHIDGNTLNNEMSNLRIVDIRENRKKG